MKECIFITGAAAGIGRETARLFASRGWFVGAADRDEEALAALQDELGEGRCSTHVMDVVDEVSVKKGLADFAERTGGQLRLLHNNAGILKVGPFEEISLSAHRAVVEVNVIGLMTVLHAAFPYLKATPNAQVVNMSSASAAYGIPDFASYSASKHAVRAMTEALDIEWEPHGIRVGDLMPPFVNTGMVQQNEQGSRLFERLGVNLTPDVVAAQVWAQVEQPRLHRPISMQFKALWPIAKSAPAAVTRGVLRKLWRQ
ncbi:short chain dehydrogenase [Marinobacter lipolyticus SM19]|uniref:Short chain dehydrogenase n=1 Tax=Marinobacter lipolyticus SM19 TaxID=1318628 RepID=R8B5U4_9GAMM|nr:SDR family oxidoreductase [Marinobacter lipolyticus]EON93962.1 short chain dehydrogenase [Marinobacter lipolyticus SM19]